jgi:hypothetical protein
MKSCHYAVTEADLVVVESRRFSGDQVPAIWRLEAREVGFAEKRTFYPDRLLQAFALGLKFKLVSK